MTIGKGAENAYLSADDVRQIVTQAFDSGKLDGKRVVVLIPDGTRTMPMPRMFALLQEILRPRVKALDYLVALGTHTPMTDQQLSKLVGSTVVNGKVGETNIFNHRWEKPETFTDLGTIPAVEIAEITGGKMSQDIPVTLNKLILQYHHIIICGPVFPHEVVGFSGGNKYFFPGIGGAEIINFTHWLGAVITNYEVIGAGYTPVRAVIDRAASLVPVPTTCLALVVTHHGLAGLYYDSAPEAWKAASALSAKVHIKWVDKPFKRVLSVMPPMYDDLWTAAKGMYKVEPAIADGGEVIIYSPHIDEVSYTHGRIIDEIGYHVRDYFLKQWEKFRRYPGGVVAHSTHVKGMGTYDADTANEEPRIQVSLATRIPEERCRRINLDYVDPATIDIESWRNREAEGVLVIPRAGETLYRVTNNSAEQYKTQ
ncbi:MAG TPA: lactate racemase domain-containing protein [Terriglobales bacterium]|nr:lactate racemase domain-containing protein [Terriglobales bacterium]